MNISDIKNLLRPKLWVFVLGVYLIAFLAIDASISFAYLLLIPIFIMICSASITFNHWCDYESDKKSRQLYRFPVAGGAITKQTALLVSLALMTIPLALAYFLSMTIFYLVLLADFMIFSYSSKPFRIKEMPYLETIWNGIGYGSLPYYIALLAAGKEIITNLHLLGLIPFFVAASGHILLQVRDIRDDRKGRVKTTSTQLGMQRMIWLSKIFVLLAGAITAYLAAIGFMNYFAWLALATGAIIYLEHRRMKNVEKSYGKLQLAYLLGGLFFFMALV